MISPFLHPSPPITKNKVGGERTSRYDLVSNLRFEKQKFAEKANQLKVIQRK
jgi:hypothetical protein